MRELALLARRARAWQAWPSSGLSGWPPQLGLHSAYSTGDKADDKEEGSLLLQGVETAPFHLSLEALRRSNSAMPYSQLLRECQDSLAVSSEEAERVCLRLRQAGVFLKLRDTALLRPGDILAQLGELPQGEGIAASGYRKAQARLAEVQATLGMLGEQKAALERRARWKARAAGWAGLAVVSAQWALLFRLTYYELSWDVIEPVGYFLSGVNSILAALWFLSTNSNLSWSTMHQSFQTRWERKAFARAHFDLAAYEGLRAEAQQLRAALGALPAPLADPQPALAAARSSERGIKGSSGAHK